MGTVTYYHGSPAGGLKEIKPFLSEHGKAYVYFSENPVVALLYAVKPVPKPFSFYPYGFSENGIVVYSEYYEDAFYDIYKGKKGYLYSCYCLPDMEALPQINGVRTSMQSVKPDEVSEIPDLYTYYKEQEEKALFCIKPYGSISDKEMDFVRAELARDAVLHNLKHSPEHAMSRFLKVNFPEVWEEISASV